MTFPSDLDIARQADTYERNWFGHLPVCIAKTHLSISSDPSLRGGIELTADD